MNKKIKKIAVVSFGLLLATTLVSCLGYGSMGGNSGHGGHDNMDGHHGGGGHSEMKHWDAPIIEANKKNPVQYNHDSVDKGKNLFKVNCASCHGIKADGTGPMGEHFKIKPTNLIEMSNQHKDGDFFWKITTGKGNMPSFKNTLEAKQRWDLVNYIQSLSKKDEHNH